jgi:hypothetical protein
MTAHVSRIEELETLLDRQVPCAPLFRRKP